jgi:adenylate cyclase
VEIRLQALARDAVGEMIQQRLQVIEIPPELATFIHRYAAGNPFYCEELVLSLRDTGRIQVSRGLCLVDGLGQAASSIDLPSSLERAIVSRIDVLAEEDQIALKVASAIGEEFTVDMLESVIPERASKLSIGASVKRLMECDFLVSREAGGMAAYDFRHSISREATYNLLSFAQRRILHSAIATFIEGNHAAKLQPFNARLARHWEQGGHAARALHYLELAAQQALLNYGNHDAIRYVDEMLSLSQRAELSIADDRRASWEIISGDAYHELSEYERSSEHYARAMRLLGQQLPETPARKVRALAHNCAVQLKARLWVSRAKPLVEAKRIDLRRAAHIYEHLSEQYFFLNDSLAVLNGTLASLNLAEECGAAPETIRGYSALALGLAMSGLVRPARGYSRRAYLLAEQDGGLPEMARVQLVGGVLEYGLGQWTVVEQRAEKAIALYRKLGDRTRVQNSQAMATFAALLSGDRNKAERRHKALSSELSDESSAQVRAWSLSVRVLIDSLGGGAEPTDVEKLRGLAEAKLIRTDRLLCLGVVAAAYLQRGDTELAVEVARQGLAVLGECGVVWGGYAYGAAGVVDVLLSHWEQTSKAARAKPKIRQRAELAVRHLSRLARTSPVCRPYALLAAGRVSFMSNHAATARRRWRRAANAAEQLQMGYEQAKALHLLGRSFASNDPSRSRYLQRASEIDAKLGLGMNWVEADGELSRP